MITFILKILVGGLLYEKAKDIVQGIVRVIELQEEKQESPKIQSPPKWERPLPPSEPDEVYLD